MITQEKCIEALKSEVLMHACLTQTEKIEMVDKVRSSIILYLGDKVLTEVAMEKIMASIWAKFESSYMTKSLSHRLYLKQ